MIRQKVFRFSNILNNYLVDINLHNKCVKKLRSWIIPYYFYPLDTLNDLH